MKRSLGIVAACVVLWAGPVRAELATLTMEGLASGTFEGQSFTNAQVAFTLSYDTANVQSGIAPNGSWDSHVTGTGGEVSVGGIGSAAISGGFADSYSQNKQEVFPPSMIGLFLPGTSPVFGNIYAVLGGFSPYNADVDLAQSFGPQPVTFGPPPLPFGTVFTSEGDLVITGIGGFQWTAEVDVAAVPAPPGFLLAGLGLLGLPFFLRKR